jgi:hypothetical protein
MAITLSELRTEVLSRLGDSTRTIWSRAEINSYLEEGYNQLAIDSRPFWDVAFLEDTPYTGNYNGSWEKDYFDSDEVIYSQFNKTGGDWEDDYDDDSLGLRPCNHTSAWEWDYITTEFFDPVVTLPTNFYQVERAVWDNKRILPSTAIELESDPNYETTEGDVIAYRMEMDGINKLRKYRRPSSTSDEYAVTGTWGILRDPSDITSDTPTGTWGAVRRITGEYATGTWGLVRRVQKQTDNLKIEYFRRGNTVSDDDDEYEFPDVYVKYVRHYCMWKCYARDGAGQDLELAGHYKQRYDVGVLRIERRKSSIASQVTLKMGGPSPRRHRPPRPRRPWEFGQIVRH